MADAWNEYLKRQAPTTSAGGLGALFAGLGGTQNAEGASGLQPNKQGLYTPSLMQSMPRPGPATPINYGAIRSLLNSGVLRTGKVAAPAPMPAPEPVAPTQNEHPLARLFSLFGGLDR